MRGLKTRDETRLRESVCVVVKRDVGLKGRRCDDLASVEILVRGGHCEKDSTTATARKKGQHDGSC